jgi:geranylgeranyl diphosphate synthase type II
MLSYESLKQSFEEYIKHNRLGENPTTLYDPVDYIMTLGGKRMRPMLLLIAYQLYADDVQQAMPAAMAVEVFHNFSLVHDDIMDGAPLRRGKQAVHAKYGVNGAILTGDVMLIRCFDFLLTACHNHPRQSEILQTLIDAATGICAGQQLDLDFEQRLEITVDEYLEMNTLKTAILLGAALRIGALLGDGPLAEADTLYEAGVLLGQAFQIQDDVLDVYGDETGTGKRRGGDIVNAKKTFLYAYTLQHLGAMRKQTFGDLYNEAPSNPEVKIQQVIKWFDETGAQAYSLKTFEALYKKGLSLLETLGPSPALLRLTDLISQLRKRES